MRKRTLADLADSPRSAAGVDDQCVGHGLPRCVVCHHSKVQDSNWPLSCVGVCVLEVETESRALTVSEGIRSRRSCRSFSARPVDAPIIRGLLDTARFAPSGGNLQPWIVHVLSGDSMSRFRAHLAPRLQVVPFSGEAEYHVYPPKLKEPYRSRRFKVGEDMYGHIGLRREDTPARLRQFACNYDFFGAPVGMFFFLDPTMGSPQWSDVGMLMQNLMLLAP